MRRNLDMYRRLTKLFESVLLEMFDGVLSSDDLQFGFKKNGCNDALFAFNETVRYFTRSGCKVYSAFLDASKAFDSVTYRSV